MVSTSKYSFCPLFLYLHGENVFMFSKFLQMSCICHFVFFVLHSTSYVYIQCGFIPNAAWRFSIFFNSFRSRKLALNRRNILYFRCRHSCLFEQVLPHWGLLTTPGSDKGCKPPQTPGVIGVVGLGMSQYNRPLLCVPLKPLII